MLNLNNLMLNSADPKTLAEFYSKVLQKKPDWEDKENNFSGFATGSSFIMVGPHDKVTGKNTSPERLIFFFETKDVQGEFDRIKTIAGASVVKAPYNPSEDKDGWLATMADPDGNYFQLASPWQAA